MKKIPDHAGVLLDSDVVRHFIKGERIQLLYDVFGPRLIFLDVVRDELFRSSHIVKRVENFISFNSIRVIPLPTDDMRVMKEFTQLTRRFGYGESACMAYARFNDNIIASSNLKDIVDYCERNAIVYVTTMDILIQCLERRLLAEEEADEFISLVKSRGSILPFNTIKAYKKRM